MPLVQQTFVNSLFLHETSYTLDVVMRKFWGCQMGRNLDFLFYHVNFKKDENFKQICYHKKTTTSLDRCSTTLLCFYPKVPNGYRSLLYGDFFFVNRFFAA
jgi:hypothetical protein